MPQVSGPPALLAHWVVVCQTLQPSAPLAVSATQVRMSVPAQMVPPRVAQPVPATVPTTGQAHAPLAQKLVPPQVVVPVISRQLLLSVAQVATVSLSMQ